MKKMKTIISGLLLAISGCLLFTAVPTPVIAQEEQEGDWNGDGEVTPEDWKYMLECIVHIREDDRDEFDINGDGRKTVGDRWLLTSAEDSSIPFSEEIEYHMRSTKNELKVQLVSCDSGGKNYDGYFDIAVLYDKSKLQLEDISWSPYFLRDFPEYRRQNCYVKKDMGDYAVLAGCYFAFTMPDENFYELATLTFSYKTEEKETGDIFLVNDEAQYNGNIDLMKEHKIERMLVFDINRDGEVDLDDAANALKMALKIIPADEVTLKAAGTDAIDLQHASTALREALKINTPGYVFMDGDHYY